MVESKEDEMGRACSTNGRDERYVGCKILVEKPSGKRLFGISGPKRDNNIKMDFKGNGCEVVDWVHLTQDVDQWRALVNVVMNLWVPKRRGIS
jgi:hypothetical protein